MRPPVEGGGAGHTRVPRRTAVDATAFEVNGDGDTIGIDGPCCLDRSGEKTEERATDGEGEISGGGGCRRADGANINPVHGTEFEGRTVRGSFNRSTPSDVYEFEESRLRVFRSDHLL